ncbi:MULTISPECIES: UDP-glucose dehydrogenase family protein [Bacillus cereus group]|uniref:UDP-glucose 6-dehydrogenase n=1 Tax=Bacillus cereus TaxID=1396 RepID=A0A9X8J215_BACCE|nr:MULTISPECIES: UDP-glucose/GDP-mannose dehydrogenase family protein [Bacillus cereus group]MDF9537078.1 UDP-glucose/GDP-mannose dehydrogenase family protein [Bacillus cereus]MDF9583941.1 UDP-glucose/GDP-mannose dehydrogenase family protein [Bacillus cereus]MDG1594176.1 UDP-glucose/GDP-mannose dehydrogenase family protein [Bacillus cereus]OFC75494.1 UDP-glucose 6-dehydrogenase YwqF [Bacillus thuringiensis]RWQ75265.1 UDP-glucose/GDP-mannose dehydrogenase family protein [Bacillus cereus]
MTKIAVVGTGYVGLVSGAILSDFGHAVTCVDVDQSKIENLKNGVIPIYEPGLETIVQKNHYYKRLNFTTDIKEAVENNEVIFIAVGTPPADDGSADLQYVLAVAESIAKNMNGYKVIVDKSTVPVGTGQIVKSKVKEVLVERGVQYDFDVVSNPEFLREGSAVRDFTHPDRVVIGAESERALELMKDVYRVLYLNETPFVETNIETAEMIKYAANAFLAMKITFINEVANVCEKVGADVQKVAKAMGQDGRISPKFLHAGPGYGGSCFPKDTKALARIAHEHGETISLIEATVEANEKQKLKMVDKIVNAMGEVEGKIFAILGITFKPNTDDMRDAPALVILPELAKRGAKFKVYDPEGLKEGAWRLEGIKDSITWCETAYEAIASTSATVILTEWNEFRNLDFDKLREIDGSEYFFDLRNIYNKKAMIEKGFKYYGVGV